MPTEAQVHAESLEDRSRAVALATNRASNQLILHELSTKKKRQLIDRHKEVLEEEDYLDTMDSIIRRDFYPAIAAMEKRLQEETPFLRMRGTQLATPNATPSIAPTPIRTEDDPEYQPGAPGAQIPLHTAAAAASSSTALQPHSSSASPSNPDAADAAAIASIKFHPHELRLGSFLELHTSEDNAAFSEMNTKRRKALHDKYWWANSDFDAKVNDQRLILVDSDKTRSGNIDTWKHTSKNALFYYPDHGGMSERDIDSSDTPVEAVKRAVSKKSASIEYENTRFPGKVYNPFPGRNASSKDGPGETATPKIGGGSSSSSVSSTPQVNGYRLVRTPTPLVRSDESPLMTWGQVIAPPDHLTHEDTTDDDLRGLDHNSVFRVQPNSERDLKAWGLAEQAKKKEIEQKKRKRLDSTPVPMGYAHAMPSPARPASASSSSRGPSTPGPSSSRSHMTPTRQVMMSPAGQRLLDKAMRVKAASGSGNVSGSSLHGTIDTQLRSSYGSMTPTHGSVGVSDSIGRRQSHGGGTQRPPVPTFHASPSPIRLAATPQRTR